MREGTLEDQSAIRHSWWNRPVVDLTPATTRLLRRIGAAGALATSLALAAGTWLVGLPQDPEGYGFGSEVSGPVQLVVAGLVGAASLFALRWPIRAASVIAVAAVALGLFASMQCSPSLTVALAAAVMAPGVVLWFGWQAHETAGTIAIVALISTTLLGTVAVGGSIVFDHYFGPSHPESVLQDAPPSEAAWLWLGGVTADRAVMTAGGLVVGEAYEIRLTSGDRTDAKAIEVADEWGVARFTLSDLSPSTAYDYVVSTASAASAASQPDGSFRTLPGVSEELVVAFGSCARVGTNGAVFEQILRDDPDLFVIAGDLHYSNLTSDDTEDHVAAYTRLLSEPAPAQLMRSIPTAYVWDDHDYGPNDADASSPSRAAVGAAYRAAVPNYGVDPDIDHPINQAFSIAGVRFVVTDTRSQRTSDSMLGDAQRSWLVDEIVASAATHRLVVWVNPTPWISVEGGSSDDWGAYPNERAAISSALADGGVENLVMVSGDAHMVAIDDGTNSGYLDSEWGFPVLHAAALDRPGSVKGGPYSEGAIAGGGQYGELRVVSTTAGTIEVTLSGRRWDGATLIEHSFESDHRRP